MIKPLTLAVSFCALAGAGLFGYSLTQETAIQVNMNHAMSAIDDSIVRTGTVVGATITALQPLDDTTRALQAISQSETNTVQHLVNMNRSLKTLGHTEDSIIQGLTRQNDLTAAVHQQLLALGAVGQQLLQRTQSSVQQSNAEASELSGLDQTTGDSVTQLRRLNQKLSPLRILP